MAQERTGLLTTKADYLHTCLGLQGDLTAHLYKKRQDLAAVEQIAKRARKSGRLTHEDVQAIADSTHWDARRFWRWPTKAEVGAALEERTWPFYKLPKGEAAVVEDLLDIYKFIEPVSVLLRFIAPEEYGILSPPVEKVLEVPNAATPSERYLHYVADLRRIRDLKRGLTRAADVDMALWVLQRGVISGVLPDAPALMEAYRADRDLRIIRCRNLAQGLFSDIPRLDLADALTALNPQLAGEIAAVGFETEVRTFGQAVKREDLRDVIDRLNRDGGIDGKTHLEWQFLREFRNDVLHANRPLLPNEVERLIRGARRARQLNQDLRQVRGGPSGSPL